MFWKTSNKSPREAKDFGLLLSFIVGHIPKKTTFIYPFNCAQKNVISKVKSELL